ncbi:hypothetical protein GALL_511610 [mine drainage metagenome]|uniref:Uncharacterized protein n=1 Tax=mine drainage metagenome TaxID=410659 RepID=A0A1J5P7Q0_9ZZZZ
MLFHELTHVDAHHVVFRIKHEAGQRLAQLGLANPGWPQKQKRAGRAVRVRQTRARTANGVGDSLDGFVLPDHTLVQFVLHQQQFVALALHHFGHRNTGGAAHHLGNFLGSDLGAQQARRCVRCTMAFLGLGFFQALFQLWQLAVLQFGDLVEVALAGQLFDLEFEFVNLLAQVATALGAGFLGFPDLVQVGNFFLQAGDLAVDEFKTLARSLVFFTLHSLPLDLQLDQAAVELVHHLGLGVHFDLDLAGRLVDQVNGFVGQETVGDVAVA